ncbi:MAG: IS3 family transposase [Mycoplasmataceae bacterium]|nr:IS3 family transposase [Mycoplasmataceae bacterium]
MKKIRTSLKIKLPYIFPIEHHWSFLKSECLRHIQYNNRTFDKIKKAVDKYYIWFNNERINSFSLKK